MKNEFLQQGIQLCVDGHDPQLVRRMLNKDINLTIHRHDEGQLIFKAIGDVAPAMGMIGTLVGLVQMLSNMDDPKKIRYNDLAQIMPKLVTYENSKRLLYDMECYGVDMCILHPAFGMSNEVNLELVPKAQHEQHVLADGDRVEIVTLVGGG